MDFAIPADLAAYLGELDEFIEREIRPLEQQDDNIRFFDYRREDARTDWDRGGLPNRDWEALLGEAKRRADAAGLFAIRLVLFVGRIVEERSVVGSGLPNDRS